MIINTAILTNQPVSLTAMVLAISHDDKLYDVTSAATCYSADENTVKVWVSHIPTQTTEDFNAISLKENSMLGVTTVQL